MSGWAGMDRKCASSTNYKHGCFRSLRVIVYIHHCLSFVPVGSFTSTAPQTCRRRVEDGETIISPQARPFPFHLESDLTICSAEITSEEDTCGYFLQQKHSSLDLPKTNCSHSTSVSHVQLQLLSGQVWSRGEVPEQVQREELRLLREGRLHLFFSHPVAHHRQLGAFCHLRAAREKCSGETGEGQ